MLTALLIVIFISFISVGLPDSVFGTAWPAIYREFGLPISLAGFISATVSIGTIISSLLSARLIKKFGTGLVTAVSTLFTAAALLGFSLTQHPAFFFILAIPLGLGAGSIDTALNSFVALHYTASHTSFLHCFYGIGVAFSPFIMSLALGDSENWRLGYFIVGMVQLFITGVCFAALPLWNKVQKRDSEVSEITEQSLGIADTLKIPGAFISAFIFFSICSLELSAGTWCSSYFVEVKSIPSDKAALITMLFYIGLASGRLVSGLVANRIGRRRVLKISFWILVAAVLSFAIPLPTAVSAAVLFFIGFAIGPVYPNLVHLTSKNFSADVVRSVMGLQQAMTYLGIMIMPPIFGALAEWLGMEILPYYLILLLAVYAVIFNIRMKNAKVKAK